VRALIAGCGYTGLRLAARLLAEGIEVVGTVRGRRGIPRLETAGIKPLILDADDPESTFALGTIAPDVCFFLIPPAPLGEDPDAARLSRVVEALRRAPLDCFVYASSTAVYGDRGDETVSESTVPDPASAKGDARLAAERKMLELGWRLDSRPRVARIAGIYGSGRTLGPAIREGRYHLIAGRDTWSSRVHVDDLVTALIAIWREGSVGRVYNVCDDEPHLSSEYARLTASMLGLDLLEISEAEARALYDPDRLARKLASRKVSNRRLRQELGVRLVYPSVREGLPAALREEGAIA
jgi:nucleoside-diphosphate-sugar epimerase